MNEKEKTFSNGAKHIALYCSVCGRHNGYKPQNRSITVTEDAAMHFKVTWLPYKGCELQDVDDKYLDNLVKFARSKYLAKIYCTEKERRRRIWEE